MATLLLGPDPALLQALGRMPAGGGDEPVAQAWDALVQAARRDGAAAAQAQYEALFVAAGTPRINPYQCFYLAGWLMDKPLAQLREDLRGPGLARRDGATELEDHLGALCEAMRVLIERGEPHPVQAHFFARHLAGWSERCLQEITEAAGGGFYAALPRFAQAFFRLEAEVLGIEEVASRIHPPRTAHHEQASS